jgi:hypothetical protein
MAWPLAGPRAAEGDAGDRLPWRRLARPGCSLYGRVPPATEGNRLCRRTKCGDRILLGRGLPALAADLVGRKIDVIAAGNTPTALAAKGATSTIPIVFAFVSDPIGVGLVASLARPGGNLTGFSNITTELMPKRLELLSELVPQARVIALLMNPEQSDCRAHHWRGAGSGARDGGAAPYSEGRHRKRDRCRLRLPRQAASRRASPRPRCVLHQPARAARGAGITPCRSGDVRVARVHRFRRTD